VSRFEPDKPREEFRTYHLEARASVKEFYRLNHTRQTLAFVREKKAEYAPGRHGSLGMWEVLDRLNSLVDDSDPDLDVPQIDHALQTAEALRRDGAPDWLVLTGLIHDAGKLLCSFGEPQWSVVGDTFPVGCAFSETIVYAEFLADNPDRGRPEYQTSCGIYAEHCGLDAVHLSWGHDEYLYQVVRDHLPEEAGYVIRYHSCYPAHREGAYEWLMNEHDHALMPWVRRFNAYDLYSKSAARPDAAALRPYYEELAARFLPARLRW
jgi:inositol oxygenase